jgi:hypothetical protein
VVRAFIEDNLKPAENRKRLLQAVERVGSLAHDKALIDVFERFALDPLEAVPCDAMLQSIAHRA